MFDHRVIVFDTDEAVSLGPSARSIFGRGERKFQERKSGMLTRPENSEDEVEAEAKCYEAEAEGNCEAEMSQLSPGYAPTVGLLPHSRSIN